MRESPMRCEILTLFPEMVEAVLNASMLKRARDKGLLGVRVVNLRDYAEGPHKTADDAPYGGGPGMVLKPEPVFRGMEVPEILRSGNHQAIEAWRRAQALQNTYMKRPDLLDRATLTSDDRQVLHEFSRRGGA